MSETNFRNVGLFGLLEQILRADIVIPVSMFLAVNAFFILVTEKLFKDDFDKPLLICITIAVELSILAVVILWRINFQIGYKENSTSVAEGLSAAERQAAVTGEVLTRDFETRVRQEVNAAVNRLTQKADQMIDEKIDREISSKIDTDLVGYLGETLAKQTDRAWQFNKLSQETNDRFVQMRLRALQYASSADRQARTYRAFGLTSAASGILLLIVGAIVALAQFAPTDLEKHFDITAIFVRQSPSIALVALCEFLALIMFRYQSKSLEYMRYFTNEATNLDARHTAFQTALYYQNEAQIYKLIENLERTERNVLLGKDQRTIELANNEIEDRLIKRFKGTFEQILQKKENAS